MNKDAIQKPKLDPESSEGRPWSELRECKAAPQRCALTDTIYIAIRTAPKRVLSGLRDKNPTAGDRAASELAEIVEKAIQRHVGAVANETKPPAPSVGGWARN